MGWSFRRSINLGPLRLNLSKKGAGFSVGGRGLRAGRDAKGRDYSQLSIPGTGIYNRQYYPKVSVPPPTAAPTNPSPAPSRQMSPTAKYMITLAAIGGVLWFLLRFLLH